MKAPPKWAQDLLINAILYLQSKGYKAELPELNWRHGKHSSGRCNKTEGKITVTAGKLQVSKSRVNQKLILLHEIAHIATDTEVKYLDIKRAKKRGWHSCNKSRQIISKRMYHTDSFWNTAWLLYRWAKLPIKFCLSREQDYRKGAAVAYRKNKTEWRHNDGKS